MFGTLKVSTSTIIGVCDCSFDIDLIFSKLEVKDDITKIKCNDKEKTKDSESACKTFYNQITIHFDDNVNLKLFNNGKFQISGIKDAEKSFKRIKILLEHISTIKGDSIVMPVYYKGVYVHKNKIITPHEDGYICDNMIKNQNIIINNNVCSLFEILDKNILIQKNHENKEKLLFDCFGRNIGKVVYNMIRKNKNLCIKNAVYTKKDENTYEIFKSDKYKTKIGEIEIVLFNEYYDIKIDTPVKLYFRCCSQFPTIKEHSIANTNFNIKMNIGKNDFFDRDTFCSVLESKNIKFLYEPSKYPGVKFSILDTKITIFRTGSILFSKKNENVDIQDVLKQLEELFPVDIIKKKHEIVNKENNITIWDLL